MYAIVFTVNQHMVTPGPHITTKTDIPVIADHLGVKCRHEASGSEAGDISVFCTPMSRNVAMNPMVGLKRYEATSTICVLWRATTSLNRTTSRTVMRRRTTS